MQIENLLSDVEKIIYEYEQDIKKDMEEQIKQAYEEGRVEGYAEGLRKEWYGYRKIFWLLCSYTNDYNAW